MTTATETPTSIGMQSILKMGLKVFILNELRGTDTTKWCCSETDVPYACALHIYHRAPDACWQLARWFTDAGNNHHDPKYAAVNAAEKTISYDEFGRFSIDANVSEDMAVQVGAIAIVLALENDCDE